MKTYEQFADALIGHGVDRVFGLMGDANMFFLADFQSKGKRFVPVVHEVSAVSMADTYSRMTRGIGVASVTHGPGLTNTITGLIDATRTRSKVLVITGDPPPEPTHMQRLEISALCGSVGVGYEKVHKPETLVRDLNRAMRRVVSEGRPIVLNLPLTICLAEAEEQADIIAPSWPGPVPGNPDAVDEALGLLASAKRPVILAGRGAVSAGAREPLIRLSDQLGALLSTTAMAKEFFRGHPSNLGIFGSMSHEVASSAIAESDCIIAFGASLNRYTTMGGELVEGKRLVQVDVDGGQLGAFVAADQSVVGDAAVVARAMSQVLEEAEFAVAGSWLQRYQGRLAARVPEREFTDSSTSETVDLRRVMMRLNELLPVQRTVVSDVGRFVTGAWPYLEVPEPARFTAMTGFGSIGLGMAGAIGAAIAHPGELTVALIGDGGFMMHMAEFTTAVREKLPILTVILNDGAYGAEHHKLRARGIDTAYSLNDWPEMVPMACAMGARGGVVRTLGDLDAIAEDLREMDGPYLIDIRLDPEAHIAY